MSLHVAIAAIHRGDLDEALDVTGAVVDALARRPVSDVWLDAALRLRAGLARVRTVVATVEALDRRDDEGRQLRLWEDGDGTSV